MAEQLKTPKVFISYSWTSEEHLEWVINFATRLMNDGIDVILDQWDLTEGQDKYHFMEKMVTDASVSKVLALCDKRYAEKADGREGGVGTESQIISKKVYDSVAQEKFIPIVCERDDDGDPYLPIYFQGRIYIDFSDEDQFEQSFERLVRNLFGKPEKAKPALGKAPAHILLESAPVLVPAQKLARLKEAVLKGKSHVPALIQDFLDSFIGCMEEFRVVESPQDNWETFDKAIDSSIDTFVPFRDCFVDFVVFCSGYIPEKATYEKVATFLESLVAYHERPDNCTSWNKLQFDNYKFISYELFLYLIATLLKKQAYDGAAFFLDHRYIYRSTLGGSELNEEGIGVFNDYIFALDEVRKQRRKMNWISVAAELLKERATNPLLTFQEIVQADFFMFIRTCTPPHSGRWYPRCAPYLGRGASTLELFARVSSERGLNALRILLGATDIVQLAKQLNQFLVDPTASRILSSGEMWHVGVDVGRLVNIQRITELAQKSLE